MAQALKGQALASPRQLRRWITSSWLARCLEVRLALAPAPTSLRAAATIGRLTCTNHREDHTPWFRNAWSRPSRAWQFRGQARCGGATRRVACSEEAARRRHFECEPKTGVVVVVAPPTRAHADTRRTSSTSCRATCPWCRGALRGCRHRSNRSSRRCRLRSTTSASTSTGCRKRTQSTALRCNSRWRISHRLYRQGLGFSQGLPRALGPTTMRLHSGMGNHERLARRHCWP